MATELNTPVRRETKKVFSGRNVIITLAPAGSQPEALVGLRLKGTRTQYVVAVSDLYRTAAMWHGQKVTKAKAEARRNGIPWRVAKKQFYAANRI